MKAIISPGKLSGSIEAIPSKSEAHRLLICAALAKNPTKLELGLTSEDIEATLGCIKKMGCTIERSAESIIVYPGPLSADPVFDCRESGSTLRFLLPVAAALFDRSSFIGRGRLPQRPMEPLLKAMESKGVRFSQRTLPFTASGKLIAGEYEIAGNVSSQYITGLLLALPLLSGDSVIKLTTAIESKPYLDITAVPEQNCLIPILHTADVRPLPAHKPLQSLRPLLKTSSYVHLRYVLITVPASPF